METLGDLQRSSDQVGQLVDKTGQKGFAQKAKRSLVSMLPQALRGAANITESSLVR